MRRQIIHFSPPPGSRAAKASAFKSSATAGKSRNGFSLVELLVVVTILLLLIGLAPRLLAPSSGAAVQQTSASLGGLFQRARTLAILKGVPASVRIHHDPADPEKYLRYALVAYLKDGTWTAADAGTYFSAGVLFDAARSRLSSQPDPAPVDLRWASRVGKGGAVEARWLSYDFDSNGVLAVPEAQAVICAGRVGTDGEAIMDEAKSGGFWINRFGAQSYFESNEDILQ